MQSMNGSLIYALRDVPGKGKGLVVIENIPKGTRILLKQPNVAEQSLSIIRTNGLPIKANGIGGGSIKQHTVHALRDIPKGEKITINYLEQSQENNKKLERINQLDDLIGRDGMQMNFSLRTLQYIDERVYLYNKQGPGNSSLPRAGRIFAERAVEGWRTAHSSNSKELYGLSMKWKTSSDEVLQGLDPNDFEDWLWRREKLKKLEQLGHFAALPNSNSVNLDFYKKVDGTYQPLRYWCFLGEIVNSTTLHHLELELTNVDDKKIPLHFNTNSRGSELAPAQIQKGYTVTVLYAQRHVFTYRDPSIRHEDP
ncbi:hypothetical protein K469DRAFT_788691 [Zopfia rhizophila CBS 207.26]|uniref:SET domain-containing protein n=1 Tax=Zopfia rhizophila CBS 207.26 TaxID=1314779 RepID=A0A6A6D4R0_9PEZI|nr:hypothetical protein K469DRAFT_788691 [Zopfia rhizophila CBS 207.26]